MNGYVILVRYVREMEFDKHQWNYPQGIGRIVWKADAYRRIPAFTVNGYVTTLSESIGVCFGLRLTDSMRYGKMLTLRALIR